MNRVPGNGRHEILPVTGVTERPNFLSMTYGQFKERVADKEILPPRNAADLVWRALTGRPELKPVKKRNGTIEYPVFSQRTDGKAVYGNTREIHELMKAIRTQAETGMNDSAIFLVGESGTGKSALLTVIEQAVMDETAQGPVHVIKGCPINEFATKLDRPLELCPHCRAELANMRSEGKGAEDMTVEPVEFGEGRGIAHTDPTLTKIDGSGGPDYWAKVRMNAGGGILFISEATDHDTDMVLRGAKDYLRAPDPTRGRRVPDREAGVTYLTDTLIIGATTPAEMQGYWDTFKGPDGVRAAEPLKERITEVHLGLNLEQSAEVKIYEQQLAGITGPHRSPQLLQAAAELALLTRINPSREYPSLAPYQKMLLFDGRRVEGVTPEMVDRVREESAINLHDGAQGLTPVQMSKLLRGAFSQVMDAGEGQQCVNPVDFFRSVIDRYGQMRGRNSEVADKVISAAQEALNHYNMWLVNTIVEAFTPNYQERMNQSFQLYGDMVDVLLGPDKGMQDALSGQPTRANFENDAAEVEGYVTDLGDSKTFREGVMTEIGQLIKQRRDENTLDTNSDGSPDTSDFWQADLPFMNKLRDALHRKLSGGSVREQWAMVQASTNMKTLNPDQVAKLAEVRQRLINPRIDRKLNPGEEQGYGFCPCCVDKLMRHAASISKDASTVQGMLFGASRR